VSDQNRNVRLLLLWLAGIDLRLTILATPPLLPLIHRDLHLSEFGVAAMTNLPVLTLAGSSVFGSLLVTRLGARGALVLGLWAIAISSCLRGLGPSTIVLFAMTFVMGLGIALVQPVFPTLSRQWFPTRIALATSVWSNGLLMGEAISASLTLPLVLPLVGGSWEWSFVVWGAIVALTAVAFTLFSGNVEPNAVAPSASWFPNFRDPQVWRLGVLLSAASLTYFGANTFVPEYLHAGGRGYLIAPCLAALNLGQLPASLVIGFVPMRHLLRWEPPVVTAGLLSVALVAFLRFDGALAVAAAALIGFCVAYIMIFSFAVPALIAREDQVTRLASGMFTIGYTIAFVASLASGALWDLSHASATAFIPVIVAVFVIALLGPRFGKAAQRAFETVSE
jgi:CP family cyanate transporter-like MFS transporter